ncbi:ABC transporter permease [Candidatus Azambacteria bacterium]|nr:ABC transporter permease [Candidatus Azambacteria bacterium]
MTLKYSLKTALKGIQVNKSRASLTILGIVIGVTAIMLVMALGEGAHQLILGQIQGLGSKTIFIAPGRQPTGPSDFAQVFSDALKERDLALLERKTNVPNATRVLPIVFGGETILYGSETHRATIFGSSEPIAAVFDVSPAEGVFFTDDDVRGRAEVAVIGSKVKKELFGDSDAVGEKVKIKGRNFKVIGVLSPKGQASLFDFDDAAFIPYTAAQQYIFGIKYFHRFVVEADSEDAVPQTVLDIEATLRESHNITGTQKNDFFMETQTDMIERLGVVTNVLTLFLGSVAAISLIVGGIGIMNIMLVSVTERTREIGLRKAVGATNKDILYQFLLEAMALTATGGAIGIALGAVLSFITAIVLSNVIAMEWKFTFPISAALLGVGVSAAVGLVFGLYPARQASRKSPIEALRYE